MRRVLSACAGGRSGEGGPYLSAACLFRVPLFRRDLVTSHPAFGRRRAAQPARGPRPALTGLLSQAFIGQTTLLFGCRNAHHRRSGCKSCQDPIHESSGPARTPQVAYSGNRHAPPCWTTVERLSPCSPRHAQGLRFCFFFLGFSLLFPLFFFPCGRGICFGKDAAGLTPVWLNIPSGPPSRDSRLSATSDEPLAFQQDEPHPPLWYRLIGLEAGYHFPASLRGPNSVKDQDVPSVDASPTLPTNHADAVIGHRDLAGAAAYILISWLKVIPDPARAESSCWPSLVSTAPDATLSCATCYMCRR
ncbi:hypothetical protein VUR80DRAFT_5601 [Thermomyces stellatus]